jgi:EmrB/QacA subfamily drug resistance transporter
LVWSSQTAGDVCVARAAGEARHEYPALVLAASILASSLAFVDGSVVNVGLPAIGRDLHGGAADLQWVINLYLLPLSSLLLLGGAVGDRFGRRDILVFGIGIFAVGSALCAASSGLAWLLAARTMQGIGAAFLLPNSLAVLGGAYSGAARGRAIGIWSASSAITAAIGPVLGGWLIDSVGWRAIFLVNLPLAAVAIGLALGFVRDPPRSDGKQPLDAWGAALATASLAALTWSLTAGGGAGGWTGGVLAIAAIGVALAGVFLWTERRRRENAMMPIALFASADFVGLTGLTFLLYGALGALLVFVPFVLIRGADYSGTMAGAALLPFPLVLAAASPAMGALAGRVGSRVPLIAGPLIVAAGFVLLLRVDPAARFWSEVFPAMLLIALGMSCIAAPLTTAVLASVDARHTGVASGLNSAVARSGGMVATALLGGVFAAQGKALFGAFHIAVIACAIASLLAGVFAFTLIGMRARLRRPA